MSGAEVELQLEKIGIICNKNAIPGEKRKFSETSGIRLGTAAITSRGMLEKESIEIADIIADVILNTDETSHAMQRVNNILRNFPLYPEVSLNMSVPLCAINSVI